MTALAKIDTDATLHGIWESECAGKVKYPSRESAEFVIQYNRRKLSSRLRNGSDDGLDAYRCRFCGSWHLGH